MKTSAAAAEIHLSDANSGSNKPPISNELLAT
jgi:hypothetical protein